jgi:hypothetical protein
MPALPGSTGPAGLGAVLAVVALALGGTLAPFTLFAFGQSRVPAEVAGGFLNLEPLVGAIAGAAAFGDPVGLVQVAGGLAILGGIALSSLPLIAGRRAEARRAATAPVAAPVAVPSLAPAPALAAVPDLAPDAKTSGAAPAMRGLVVIHGGKFDAGGAGRPPARGRRQVTALDSRSGRAA